MFKKKFISKKVLLVKEAQNGPLDSSSPKNWPGGQRDPGRGVVLHVQGEVYQSTLNFGRRVAGYQEWCPWSIQPKIWGYLDHSHRGSGSTPSNSYFWPLGVLPVLLYHFCGSTSYEYSQCLFFNSLGVLPQVLYHFCGSTPTKVV